MSYNIILLGLLVFLGSCSPVLLTDGEKVRVDFYYESLCPYCQQFMERSLKKAAQTEDFWKICDFTMNPYGNARRSQENDTWRFTCQHGVRQCEGNLIEACALNMIQQFSTKINFIICLQANSSDWTQQGIKCSSQLGVNWSDINVCAKGKQGIDYLVQMAEKTEALVPPHNYVPWVVVNGQHNSSTQSKIISNMVQYVCSIYQGPVKIAACG